MLHRVTCCCLALMCGSLLTNEAAAQSNMPVTAEATVGFRVGHGGSYDSRGGVALDLTSTYRLRETRVGTLIAGATLGIQTPALATDLSCLVLPDGGCAPDFPGMISVSALAGVQRGSTRTAAARLLLGPTYHQTWEDGGGIGLQGRVDVWTPTWNRTSVVAGLRHTLLPSIRGEAVGITSFGVGLRVQ